MKISKIIKGTYALCAIAILAILMIGPFVTHIHYLVEREFLVPNIVVMIALTAVLYLEAVWIREKREKTVSYDKAAVALAVVLFLFQLFECYSIYFYIGADPGEVYAAGMNLARGAVGELNNAYFSACQNNLLLAVIYGALFQIWPSIGIVIGIDAVFNTLSCLLIYYCLKEYMTEDKALLGMILGILMIGISPWTVGYYSDQFALLTPILLFHIYQQTRKRDAKQRILLWAVMLLIGAVFFRIKPTAIIVLLGIFVAEFVQAKGVRQKMAVLLLVLCFAFCLKASGSALKMVCAAEGFEIDDDQKLGWQHFLMVGLHDETDGMASDTDSAISSSASNAAERNALNLKTCEERIKDYGVLGLAKHAVKKMLVTFNDGSFAWGVEPFFYTEVQEETTPLSGLLRSILYSYGDKYIYFEQFEQILWLFVLLQLPAVAFCKQDRTILALMISFVGFVLYQLLFEARARYVYIMVPLFIVMAVLGKEQIVNQIWARRVKRKGNGETLC